MFKVLLLTMTLIEGTYLQFLPPPVNDSWESIFFRMKAASVSDVNLRSSCPWTFVQSDPFDNRWKPMLFNVVRNNCIDLDRSTEHQLFLTMNGVCVPVRDSCPTSREFVGFTCTKLVETETVKRNEVLDPWNDPFDLLPPLQQQPGLPPPPMPVFPVTSVKPILTTKKELDKDDNLKDDDKQTTPLYQNLAPPFNNPNSPFFSPSFLGNGANQFQPAFLNSGMNPQVGQPPLMLQFGVNQETRDGNVENGSGFVETTEETSINGPAEDAPVEGKTVEEDQPEDVNSDLKSHLQKRDYPNEKLYKSTLLNLFKDKFARR